MNFDIKQYLLIFIGWFIQTSYQLECIQCTSPIRRLSQSWDHSCLDGTLAPLPCHSSGNATAESSYKQCVSALYRIGPRGRSGILLNRDCTAIDSIQHDCFPEVTITDLDKADDFYCTRTCSEDGCNRHLVTELVSNANKLSKNKFSLLSLIFLTILIKYII